MDRTDAALGEQPSLWQLIREDLATQREGLLSQGFWALAAHRFGHCRLSRPKGLLRSLWGGASLLATKLAEIVCGISLPEGVRVGRRLRIEHFGGVVIHSATMIGDDCLIHHGVTLGNRSEARPDEAPTLGHRVQIGAGAIVLGPVVIGDDVIIGAAAVVISDVPAGSVVVGNPARIVRSTVRQS